MHKIELTKWELYFLTSLLGKTATNNRCVENLYSKFNKLIPDRPLMFSNTSFENKEINLHINYADEQTAPKKNYFEQLLEKNGFELIDCYYYKRLKRGCVYISKDGSCEFSLIGINTSTTKLNNVSSQSDIDHLLGVFN